MKKERFLELRNEISKLRQQDLDLSNKIYAKDSKTYKIEIPTESSTIKRFKGSDLPIYFKYEGNNLKWIWKVFVKDGRIKVEKISKDNGELEYNTSSINLAFQTENRTKCSEKEWLDLVFEFAIKLSTENKKL